MKMLTRRGVLVEDMGQTYLAEPNADGEEGRTLRALQAASAQWPGPSPGTNSRAGADQCYREGGAQAQDAVPRRHQNLVMSPPEFMQRLAALVPRPRLHLIRFGLHVTSLREVSDPPLREHVVLVPNAKLRALVVPQGPEGEE